MAKRKTSVASVAGDVGLWVSRILMLVLGLSVGAFLGVTLLAKGVWEIMDQEVDGVVVKQEGNIVTLKDSNGQEHTWELEFKEGQGYEFDGAFQGRKIVVTDVDQD